MNINLINYLGNKGINIFFDGDSYEDYDIEKYHVGTGYEHEFIKLMNTYPLSYNTYMFKTKDIKEISIVENEIEIKTETREGIFDRRHRVFNFDASPIFKQLKKEQK